jgi:NAD(P)H dehydrogenase (quinone)
MNILVVYAHNEPTSLTASIKNAGVSTMQSLGHTVVESDLYALGFHPVAGKYDFTTLRPEHFSYLLEQKHATTNDWGYSPDIVSEMQKIQNADLIIFYTPIWWFSVPAIMKGWFDRVLNMGFAWDGGKIYEAGLLRGKQSMIVGLAGGPEEYYQPLGKHRATLRQILHPIHHGTLAFCGLDVLEPFLVYSSMSKTPEEYTALIETHRTFIAQALTTPRFLSRY